MIAITRSLMLAWNRPTTAVSASHQSVEPAATPITTKAAEAKFGCPPASPPETGKKRREAQQSCGIGDGERERRSHRAKKRRSAFFLRRDFVLQARLDLRQKCVNAEIDQHCAAHELEIVRVALDEMRNRGKAEAGHDREHCVAHGRSKTRYEAVHRTESERAADADKVHRPDGHGDDQSDHDPGHYEKKIVHPPMSPLT